MSEHCNRPSSHPAPADAERAGTLGERRMMPRDPDDAMIRAALSVDWSGGDGDEAAVVINIYHAMYAVASQPPALAAHTDDQAVDLLAAAMKAKLAIQRARGYGGWDEPKRCPVERLAGMLVDHIAKGDPVDVANFAMMLFCRDGGGVAMAHAGRTAVAQIPQDIAELVLRVGRAEWGSTPAHDADGHAEHIAESVRLTAEHFGQTEPQKMSGLYIEGTGTVICHTGTSPNSPGIARALTGAWNWLHDNASATKGDAA